MDLDVNQDFGRIRNWMNGQHAVPSSASYEPVYSPYTGNVIAEVPFSNRGDLDAVVSAAKASYLGWSNTNIKDRAQVMFRFKALLEQNLQELGDITALESGKLPAEARAGIMKGIEVIEFACSIPNLVAGRTLEVSQGVECRSIAEPLGVIASIVPFNFPSMVPLWTLPIALTAGNCMILKSSEQVPLSALKIAEHLQEAGLPDGVFNVVNGGREIVEGICDHDDIKAVSFVGSSKVAQLVYSRCAEHGKRVLALGGAKNHTILMPDADSESSPKGIVDSAMGCAGQRCMAVSVLVAVGQTQDLIDKMASYANSLELGEHMGAIINKDSLERINRYIDEAESMGAEVIVDGRGKTVDGMEDGYWIGPTIIDNVSADMPCACDEIFGPVLAIIRAGSLEEALKIENRSPYGNAASIFTSSGESAKYLTQHASAGMIGVNIGVPVPREPFAFGGMNVSRFGHGDITGESGFRFWTQDKKVTVKWIPRKSTTWLD